MNLLRALATVSGITLLSRIAGLAREVIFAALFGANAQTDAFNVAFRIPNLLRRLFAEGAFSQAFVPIIGEYKGTRSDEATRILIDDTATVLVWVLLAVTLAGILGAPLLVWALASGMQSRGGSFDLAVDLTRLMFPYIFLISLVAAASGVLNTWRNFAVPAFTPVLLNISIIVCALGLSRWCNPPIVSVAVGVVVGGVLQLLVQVWALAKIGRLPRLSMNFRVALADPAVKRIVKLMVPATLSVSVAQLSLIINTNIATWIGAGAVSWIGYADRLMEFPTALLGAALGTILTPSLSSARAQGNHGEYMALLDWGMRICCIMALPCAVALCVIAGPITATLFQRGAFGALDVLKTQHAVTAYGVGLIGLIMVKILAPAYYAKQDIRTPVKIAVVVLVATQFMNLVFVPLFAHAGLALSIGLGACANAALLFRGLRQRGDLVPAPGWAAFLARLGAALVVLAVVLVVTSRQFDWIALQSHPWARVGALGVVIGLSAAAYFVALFASGMKLAQFKRRLA